MYVCMNVCKDIIIMLSFDRAYMLDMVEIKLCTSKQYSLCEDKLK